MGPRLAVDVGCTTVVAAIQDAPGEAPRMLVFDDEDGPAGTLAASLTWSAGGLTRVGIEADRALDADPHRGVRGPLAHLESGSATLELGPGPVPVVALVAELLARPLRVATRELGGPPLACVLTIPAGWATDGRRARALRAAAALAGLPRVSLVASAIAAAELQRDGGAELVLVCDVGGRSGQLSLVDLHDGPGRLLATTELVAGADLFDELLYHEALRLLGERDPAAAQHLEELLMQAGGAQDDAEGARWAACQADLARGVRHCREALTSATAYELAIAPPVGLTLELDARRAGDLLQTESHILGAAAREQVAQADLGGARLRAVLVGGGALTPGLRETLEAELGRPVQTAADPVTVVARGALATTAEGSQDAGDATAPPRRRGGAPARPAPARQALRTVLEDVVVAAVAGDDIVAVVRHDAHQRVVRLDAQGRVIAASALAGTEIAGLEATSAVVVVSGAALASVFSADLHPLMTVERPLLAAAHAASAWVVAAGDEQAPVLALQTIAVHGRAAQIVQTERLGLVVPAQAGRLARRSGRPAPPRAHGVIAGGRLRFAVPSRGRGGTPAQRIGDAGPEGLGALDMLAGPGWLLAQAPAGGGATLTLTGAGPALLALGDAELASWPAGVQVRLAGREPHAPWIVAARRARWEARRLDGDDVAPVRSGDGVVEAVEPDGDALWLVCAAGGERRLVRVTAAGELEHLATLGAPLAPIGRAGAEILALAGSRGAARTLVALAPG